MQALFIRKPAMNLTLDLQAWISHAALLPLATFIFVSSITPGPNNVMLTASGANFGYQRSVPHMLGITVGCALMLFLVGAGLGAVFGQFPQIYTLLQYVGAAYLIWLAWKIATAGQAGQAESKPQPLSFWQAAAFQWVNPKAWLMSVGVVAAYTSPSSYWSSLLLGTAVMLVVNYPCISVWTLFGSVIGRWLQSPRALTVFNWGMAAMLLLSLWPLLAGHV
jgi:threonine/homoserine/homoserine lactone efflux protein